MLQVLQDLPSRGRPGFLQVAGGLSRRRGSRLSASRDNGRDRFMYERKMLGLDDAQRIVHAILAHVDKGKGPPVSIAVVDYHGDFILFARLDGASWNTAQMARMKAYTAAKLRRDTSAISEWQRTLGVGLIDWGDPNLTTLTGGVCIKDDSGLVLGAVGVSGYPVPKDDEDAARVGVAALAP